VTADVEPLIAATDGATASAIKELMRRAVLRVLDTDPLAEPAVVDDAVLRAVVADFGSEALALSRSLLGGSGDGSGPGGLRERRSSSQGPPGFGGPGGMPPPPGSMPHFGPMGGMFRG